MEFEPVGKLVLRDLEFLACGEFFDGKGGPF